MRAAGNPVPVLCARLGRARARRGFTLIEVLLALALLLVGGVCVMSVFSLAVVHGVERYMESKLDVLRSEARTLAQQAVDASPSDLVAPKPPVALTNVEMSDKKFTVSIDFSAAEGDRHSWIARAVISYDGKVLRQGRLPPMWLNRSTLDPSALEPKSGR